MNHENKLDMCGDKERQPERFQALQTVSWKCEFISCEGENRRCSEFEVRMVQHAFVFYSC